MNYEPPPRFRVRGWLDSETFRHLLEFSDYVGRQRDLSVFQLNYDKARREGYEAGDLIREIEGLGDLVPQDDLALVKEYLLKNYSVEVAIDGGKLLIKPSKVILKDYLSDFGGRDALRYSHALKAYVGPPYLYSDVVRFLKSKGLLVVDKVDLVNKAKLPRQLNFVGELRPYQQEALDKWLGNSGRGIVVLPTGAGKTVVGVAAMAKLGVKTLIVAYTKEQVKQWGDAVRKFTDGAGLVGLYYGDEKVQAPITITTYQTAFRRAREFSDKYALLIIDEAHHLPADKFKAIAISMAAPYRMGLSATAVREDGKHEEIFPLMGGIIYQKSASELIEQGYLAPFRIVRVYVKLTPEEQKAYEELRKKYLALAGGRTFDELLEMAKKGDPTAAEALRVRAQMQEIVQQSKSKIQKVVEIASEELKKGSKIIVFTQFRKQAEEIANLLHAFLIHGELDKDARLRALEGFKRAPSGVLVVTTVGDEGLDIPDANVGIYVSGTGSRRQFVQRLGRLLRPAPGKVATLYEVVASGTSELIQSRKRREALE